MPFYNVTIKETICEYTTIRVEAADEETAGTLAMAAFDNGECHDFFEHSEEAVVHEVELDDPLELTL